MVSANQPGFLHLHKFGDRRTTLNAALASFYLEYLEKPFELAIVHSMPVESKSFQLPLQRVQPFAAGRDHWVF